MPTLEPYRYVPILECGEPMVSLPKDTFAFAEPHAYIAAGAPYGNKSPWMLRTTIVQSLIKAQEKLGAMKPGWKIKIIDGYRPNAVQAYMVDREFAVQADAAGLKPKNMSEFESQELYDKIFRIWAAPSDDPTTPPPHSTGAAFDCTLVDENGHDVDMGSPVDENSDRSFPDAFAHAVDATGKQAHAHRLLLNDLMTGEGFVRSSKEWWHFSRGDQAAVWLNREENPKAVAVYGHAPE